jgi:NitT/TauT family transport system substrate-binding protein
MRAVGSLKHRVSELNILKSIEGGIVKSITRSSPNRRIGRIRLARFAVSAVALATTASLAGVAPAGASGLTTLNVAEVGGTYVATTLIGINAGIFKHYGLNLNLSYVAGTTVSIGDVLSGTSQVGFTSVGGILPADEAGDNLQLFTNVESSPTVLLDFPNNNDSLMVAQGSSITSPAQLVGQTVGLVNLAGTGALQAAIAVTQAGGKWSKVNTVVVPFANMPAEIANGTIAAAVEIQPFASDAGQKMLTNLDASTLGVPSSGYFATNSYIKANPGIIQAFAEAQQQSILYAAQHKNLITPTILAEASGLPASESSSFSTPTQIAFSTSLNPAGLVNYEDTAAAYGFLTGPVMPVSELVYTASGTPMTKLLFNSKAQYITTITCRKGKITHKVTMGNARCPAGYKKVG